jgi:hypothetical protein
MAWSGSCLRQPAKRHQEHERILPMLASETWFNTIDGHE